MGNWSDRIDELESENHDLRETAQKMDEEIQDYLYEIDRLHDRNNVLVDQVAQADKEREALDAEWFAVVQAVLDRAESAEARAVQAEESRDYWQNLANHVKADRDRLQETNESFREDLEYWSDFSRDFEESYWEQESRIEAVQERANSWFEQAKDLVRARDKWVAMSQEYLKETLRVQNELWELKNALLILGGDRED